MEFEELVTLIQNTGVTIVIIGYFMLRDWKFMTTLQETLTSLVDVVDRLKESLNNNKGA